MWRLFNWLFGWDYILWQNGCNSGIARVHMSPDGNVWYWRYKITGTVDFLPANDHRKIIWLTCKPEKYIK